MSRKKDALIHKQMGVFSLAVPHSPEDEGILCRLIQLQFTAQQQVLQHVGCSLTLHPGGHGTLKTRKGDKGLGFRKEELGMKRWM